MCVDGWPVNPDDPFSRARLGGVLIKARKSGRWQTVSAVLDQNITGFDPGARRCFKQLAKLPHVEFRVPGWCLSASAVRPGSGGLRSSSAELITSTEAFIFSRAENSLQSAALALGLHGFGGSLFQFPPFTLRLNGFSGSLFPVALRMNAKLVPIRLRKIDIIVLRGLLDVSEGQSTICSGDANDLIEPGDSGAHVPCIS
jgi:hypothetical protein